MKKIKLHHIVIAFIVLAIAVRVAFAIVDHNEAVRASHWKGVVK